MIIGMWRSYNWPKRKAPEEEGDLDFHLGERFSPMGVKSKDLEELVLPVVK